MADDTGDTLDACTASIWTLCIGDERTTCEAFLLSDGALHTHPMREWRDGDRVRVTDGNCLLEGGVKAGRSLIRIDECHSASVQQGADGCATVTMLEERKDRMGNTVVREGKWV